MMIKSFVEFLIFIALVILGVILISFTTICLMMLWEEGSNWIRKVIQKLKPKTTKKQLQKQINYLTQCCQTMLQEEVDISNRFDTLIKIIGIDKELPNYTDMTVHVDHEPYMTISGMKFRKKITRATAVDEDGNEHHLTPEEYEYYQALDNLINHYDHSIKLYGENKKYDTSKR